MKKTRIITKPIWVLSLVSLFTDISSEMLYPVMPLFLKSIGFSVLLIGVLEGLAEATAGLSKGYFGQLSDKSGKRLPFIRYGYAMSAISKPLMAIFTFPLWIFFARTFDRLGKGVRTGARDAFLSDMTTAEYKGRVFGFHRSLDTIGAFIGPCLALIFLYFFPEKYKPLFVLAFIPGIISIALTFFVKDRSKKAPAETKKVHFFSFISFIRHSPLPYKKLIAGLLAFSLFNSSDVFLLLVMKSAGMSDFMLILAYIFYNLVYAVFAYPAGMVADKAGLKKVLIAALLVFSGVYAGFSFSGNTVLYFVLFFFYGIYAAGSESIGKAWISNIVKKTETATAIGAFTALNSIGAMLASSMAGLIWVLAGPSVLMIISSAAVLLIAIYFIILVPQNNIKDEKQTEEI